MSRVPPIKHEAKTSIREQVKKDAETVARTMPIRVNKTAEAISSSSGTPMLQSIQDLMLIESDAALLQKRVMLLLYAGGITPRQIAAEMSKMGRPMDHQTVYRWVTQAAAGMGLAMAEIRETPKH